ncbi:MAG: DUF1801 domain-containing protein [Candidatus Sericytochromatia bacterium]
MNFKVDEYLNKDNKWKEELDKIREIVLGCGLIEEFKWGVPCYVFETKNIILLGKFKDYCSISFFKGALLNDKENILSKVGNNTQLVRIIKFINIEQINKLESILRDYIYKAIEIEKSDIQFKFKETYEFIIPEELQNKLESDILFRNAFQNLTEGRKRGYLIYFSEAKQSKTIQDRINKYKQRILDGKGLRDCICGLSKKMPQCDGSHKLNNLNKT